MFRRDSLSAEDITAFHNDGFVIIPEVLTDAGRMGLIDELLNIDPIHGFLKLSDEARSTLDSPHGASQLPWNDKGPWAHQLIDAPFVTTVLQETTGADFHFCHSGVSVTVRGSPALGLHHDHHHWKHHNPVNLAERERWYIQMLYYPNGFKLGDKHLSIIPGSHRVPPTKEVTPDTLLAGEFNHVAGRELKLEHVEVEPGTLVCLNARTFHGATAKPLDAPQEYRIFVTCVFKEVGPPHLHTQEIPREWMEGASPERKRLFQREPYSPERWVN